MGHVIIMRALPGSGKSTFAKQLAARVKSEGGTAVICSADDYFYELGGGTYQFDPSKIGDAHKQCFKKFIKAIQDNIDLVIVDNTNLSTWEFSPYKTYAEAMDYTFEIKQVKTNPAESFKRQQHGVPQRSYEFMNDRFNSEWVPPWWDKKEYMSTTTEDGSPDFPEITKDNGPEQMKFDFASVNQSTRAILRVASLYQKSLKHNR